jgi:uncharacterized protein (DUF433 family)
MSKQTEIRAEAVVARDPEVRGGELVFAGTRVPVEVLIDYLKGGQSIEDFLEGHPSVDRWQVEAYLELSADGIDQLRANDPRAA